MKNVRMFGNRGRLDHPIRRELSRLARDGWATSAQLTVLRHGRVFVAAPRPNGYRLQRMGQCFFNAGVLAEQDRGTYVEGFAMTDGGLIAHHAWVTLNGTDAVDVTWRSPPKHCHYFGISFSKEVLNRSITRTGYWGRLLDPLNPDEIDRVLADSDFLKAGR